MELKTENSTATCQMLQPIPDRRWRLHQDRCVYLTDHQMQEIGSTWTLWNTGFELQRADTQTASYLSKCRDPKVRSALVLALGFKLNVWYYTNIPQVAALNDTSKISLLKNCLMGAALITSLFEFDPVLKSWNHNGENSLIKPIWPNMPSKKDFQDLYGNQVVDVIFDCYCLLLEMRPDKETISLSSLIAMFTTDGDEEKEADPVKDIRVLYNHFMHLLKMYIRFKFGPMECERYFQQLILILNDLRRAGRALSTLPMLTTPDQVTEIHLKLTELKIKEAFEYNRDQIIPSNP